MQILGELGSGATGRVWHGRLLEPLAGAPAGSEVALKRLHPHLVPEERALLAFEREARLGRELDHPSLVRVLASGKDEEGPYLVMRFVPGRSLRDVLDTDGALPEPLVRRTAAQLFGALAALHGRGLFHGDIKPDNVRLDREDRAVLLDLGFARAAVDEDPSAPANPGSLAYLSPERARGAPASAAGDVFALGVVLFELCSGEHPFAPKSQRGRGSSAGNSSGQLLRRALAPGADDLLAAIATGRYLPPSRLAPQLSPFLDAYLECALRRRPEERPTAAELAERAEAGESGEWWRREISRAIGGSTELSSPRTGQEHFAPLVGRGAELAALVNAYQSQDTTLSVALISGAAGSGKSRLFNAFAARARAGLEPPLYLYTRCSELSEARPFGAGLRLLQRWLQLPEESAPGRREAELLARLVPPREAEALLAALDPTTAEANRDSFALALSQWALALAREQPLVLAVDDLEQGAEMTLLAVQRVREALSSAGTGQSRALLLLGYDESEAPESPETFARVMERIGAEDSGAAVLRLTLGPIGQADVEELVQRLFHPSAPRLRLSRVLFARSRGNPGLVVELLRRLLERNEAAPHSDDDPRLDLLVAPDALPPPKSLDRTIRERYRALDAATRLWLDRLAVVGGRLEAEFVQRAFPPTTRPELDRVLTELVRRGWLVAASNRFRFARPSYREAIYRAIPKERKRRLHRMAARALEPEPGAAARADDAWQRAFHLRAAEEWRALLALLRPLLAHATSRGYPQRALQLARFGLEAVDALGTGAAPAGLELELLEAAADAADRLGAREEERELLDRLAERDPDPERDPETAARIYLLHGRYAVATGQYGLARGMLRNTSQLAERAGADALLAESLRRLAHVQAHVGQFDEGRELLSRAESLAVDDLQLALTWLARAQLEAHDDWIEPALDHVDRALRKLRDAEPPRPGALALAHVLRARIFRSAGRPARALGAAKHAVALARRAGERRTEAEALARQGGLLLDLDRAEDAEVHLSEALLLAEEIEDRRSKALASLWLAILLWERDDPRSHASVDRALAAAREIGFYRAEALGLSIRARIRRAMATSGRRAMSDALTDSARSLEIVERHGAELFDRIAVTGTRALVLHSAGHESESRQLVVDLRRRMRRDNERIEDPALRKAQRSYSTTLLEAVLSPDGPVYPRMSAPPPL
ncbi:MAG: protein kinase [Planctomycetaceae bacterium]|nr:protein kinase [Planctomycetaceae bacterium]